MKKVARIHLLRVRQYRLCWACFFKRKSSGMEVAAPALAKILTHIALSIRLLNKISDVSYVGVSKSNVSNRTTESHLPNLSSGCLLYNFKSHQLRVLSKRQSHLHFIITCCFLFDLLLHLRDFLPEHHNLRPLLHRLGSPRINPLGKESRIVGIE